MRTETVKIYTAVPVPLVWSQALQASLRPWLYGGEVKDPARYHITLAYLGKQSPDIAALFAEQLALLPAPKSFKIHITSGAVFAHGAWYLVARVGPRKALKRLRDQHMALARKLDMPVRELPFSYNPHITLLEAEDDLETCHTNDFLKAMNPRRHPAFQPQGVAFYQSDGADKSVPVRTFPFALR